MKFGDLRRIINETPASWDDREVTVSQRGSGNLRVKDLVVADIAFLFGVPASPKGSAAARWYGVHEAIPPSVEIIVEPK